MSGDLLKEIKHNCDLSDAQFWGYFSICGLLMRYRDLYRSEQGLEPWGTIPREAITAWIQLKESRWPDLEGQEFRSLTVDGRTLDAFDCPSVNSVLAARGLAYGAGYGMYLKPTFFLAELLSRNDVEGHDVFTTGRELARDLFTSPAMLLERTIFLRKEPLKALLWDLYTQLVPGRCTFREEAFRAWSIRPGQPVDREFILAFERMVDASARVLLLHELAESRERAPSWKELLAEAADRRSELVLRALQDLLADTSERGPLAQLTGERDEGGLALFIGLMEGFRRLLFPELRDAYNRFLKDRDWAMLDDVRRSGYKRFSALRQTALDHAGRQDRDGLGRFLRGLVPDHQASRPGAAVTDN